MIMNSYHAARYGALGLENEQILDCLNAEYVIKATTQSGILFGYMNQLIAGWGDSPGIVLASCDTSTESTPDDWCVQGVEVSTSLDCLIHYTKTSEESAAVHTSVITATNNTDESILVNMLGYIAPVATTSGTKYALFEKTWLDTPVTIEPGNVAQFTYTIRIDKPST